MAFTDYNELVDGPEPMRFPISGKTYEIPPLMCREAFQIEDAIAGKTPLDDETFSRCLLGSAYDEMLGDNIPNPALRRVLLTAVTDLLHGRATAELIWQTGGDSEALKALVARETGTTEPSRNRKPRKGAPKGGD